MGLVEKVIQGRVVGSSGSAETRRYSPPPWMDPYVQGGSYPGYTTLYGTDRAEQIGNGFAEYVIGGLAGNGVIWSIERVRVALFTEARFQFQRIRNGRPGDLFGTQDLTLLEKPWENGTTADLLARMILDVDFAGNFFAVELDGEVVRLRPDWVEVVLAERYDADGMQVGWKRLGYLYYEGGKAGQDPAVFLPGEVVHFTQQPDPLANWRGMSWLTPVVREVMADTQATKHKLRFFENAATPNLMVRLPAELDKDRFLALKEKLDASHVGADNAYKTMYVGGGADVTVIGANMQQLDFKVTQGAGETRLASAGGIHPAIAGLSEGLQGSSLNAGNFSAARRLVADATMRPLWRNAAGSLEVLVPPPPQTRLWIDTRDIAFLREDRDQVANIQQTQAQTIRTLVDAGYKPESVIAAVTNEDWSLLEHSGLFSVQLQPAGQRIPPDGQPPALPGRPLRQIQGGQ